MTPTGCTRPQSIFGNWAVEPSRFREIVKICKSIDLVALAASRANLRADGAPSGPLPTLSPETPGKRRADDGGGNDDSMEEDLGPSEASDPAPYAVIDGVAVLSLQGPMTKYPTSFQQFVGGCATIPLRRAIRAAAADPRVNAVMLYIDSPGGTVAGTSELGADIRALDAIKPCYAYCSDLCASGAYWAASQCRKVYSNPSGMVGCIGAMAVLEDTSEQFKQEGVSVHVVTSDVPAGVTTAKGMGTDGVPVTPDVLAEVKRQLNDQNDLFVADVARGRKLTPDRVRAMADGRVHVGEKAKALGLVDEIASFEAAMQAAITESYQMTSEQFKAFAAANPSDPAVTAVIGQGAAAAKAQAIAENRQSLAGLMAAFPGREKFAAEQFAKGHDVTAAKADLCDVLQAELAARPATATAAAISLHQPFAGVAQPVPGNPAANHLDAGADGKAIVDPIGTFEAAWKGLVKNGMPANRAIAQVVKEQPAVYAAYLAAVGKRAAK